MTDRKEGNNLTNKINWRTAFICLALVLTALNIIYLRVDGHDFMIYCGAVKAYAQGCNPYLVKDLAGYTNSYLPFVYPPVSLLFFRPLCVFDPLVSYVVLWTLLIICSFIVTTAADKFAHPLFLGAVLLTGFRAAPLNYMTGNIDLVGLFLFSLAYYFLDKGAFRRSAAFISLASFFKLFPILYGASFLFARKPVRERAAIMLSLALPLLFLSALSYALYPDITSYYYNGITGGIGNQDSPVREGGGAANPASIFFMRHLSLLLFGSPVLMTVFYALFVAAVGYLYLRFCFKRERVFIDEFSLGVLAVMLVFPRLKPYSFTYALLPVYWLFRNFDFRAKFWVLLMISGFPLVSAVSRSRYWDYNQFIALCFAFIYYLAATGILKLPTLYPRTRAG